MMAIHIYITGNLVAESLFILAKALRQEYPNKSLHLFTTGDLLIDVDLSGFTVSSFNRCLMDLRFNPGDLVITGIMWPGTLERDIIKKARSQGAISVVVLADLAGDAAKFNCSNEKIIPDYVCVSDNISYNNLIKDGIPADIIIKAGSFYLDAIKVEARGFENGSAAQLAYCSVPNKDDYLNWKKDLGYCEVEIAEILLDVCYRQGLELIIRKHPKEYSSTKYNHLRSQNVILQNHSDIGTVDFLKKQKWVASSYSTTLLVAKKMQLNCLSVQPGCDKPQKADLFNAINIPIATNKSQITAFLNSKTQQDHNAIDRVVYNSGDSISHFSKFIRCLVEYK